MTKIRRKKCKNKLTAIFSCLTRKNSIIESIVSIGAGIYQLYAEFVKETTLHGLKHTVAPRIHHFERCLWFLLTLTAFGGAVFCALSQLSRYNSDPVVVSLQRNYRSWRTACPAVTACFTSRMDTQRAAAVIQEYWNVTEDSNPERFQYYTEFIELVSDVSFRENLQNFWKYQDDETVRGVDLMRLALAVHPSNMLNVMNSQNNKQIRWHPVITEVGMCLSYNSLYGKYQHMLDDSHWVSDDLMTCHYLSEQCYIRVDSVDNPVRYFIHSPFDISTSISNPTGEIQPGEELIIDFKAVEIQAAPSVKGLRVEQRRCRYPDEWLSESLQTYSFSLCQMDCRSRMAIMFCGCRPYFHVKGASLGGTTALFVGASVLTVVETCMFIIRRIIDYVINKFCERNNKIQYIA